MNFITKLLLGLSCAATSLTFSGQVATTYAGRCDVEFVGSSTLHSFTGHLTNQPLRVICRTNDAGEAVLDTRIEIGPRQLTTHHAKRDANMYQMFQSDRFPKLIVLVTNAPLAAAHLTPTAPPVAPGRLPVRFSFCGITKEVLTTTIDPKPLAEGWEFELESDLSLRDFKLKPPGALLGTVTVHDRVKVKAHVKLQKEPP